MASGEMVSDGIARPYKTINYAQTDAIAVFFSNELNWSDWTLNLGIRYEDIQGSVDNKLSSAVATNDQSVAAPGLGIHKQLTPSVGIWQESIRDSRRLVLANRVLSRRRV